MTRYPDEQVSDAVYARAIAAGATALMPIQDQFYGDRSGSLRDPFGHKWHISAQKEKLSQEEIQRRATKMFSPEG